MAADGLNLPAGFVIDEPEQQTATQQPSGLPEGFVLDTEPEVPQGFEIDQPVQESDLPGGPFAPTTVQQEEPIGDVERGFMSTQDESFLPQEGERTGGELVKDIGGSVLVGAAGVPRSGGETIEALGQIKQAAPEFIRKHPIAAAAVGTLIPQTAPLIAKAALGGGKKEGEVLEFVGRASSDFWAQEGEKRRKKFISEKGQKSTHPAWIVSSGIAETTPQLIADYVAGQAAGKLGKLGTSVISSTIEGNTAGAAQKGEVEDAIDAMSDEDIAQLPVFIEALEKSGGNFDKAREMTREVSSNRAYAATFLTTTMVSLGLDKVGAGTIDKWLQDPKVGKLGLRTILRMSGTEATEEALQSGFETLIKNRETGKTGAESFEGVPQAMGYGAATGLVLGGTLPTARAGLDTAQASIEGAQATEAVPEVQTPQTDAEAPVEAPVADVVDQAAPEALDIEAEREAFIAEQAAEGRAIGEEAELGRLPELEREGTFEPTEEQIDEQRRLTGSIEEKRAKSAEISRNKEKAQRDFAEKRVGDKSPVDDQLAAFRDEFPFVKTPEKSDPMFEEVVGVRGRTGQIEERRLPHKKETLVTWEDALFRAKEMGLVDEAATGPEALVPLYQGTIKSLADIETEAERKDVQAFEKLMYDEFTADIENGVMPTQEVINEAPEIWDAAMRDSGVDENTLEQQTVDPEQLFDEAQQDVFIEDFLAEREATIKKEDKDAVPVRETKKVPAQPEARSGEEVRKTRVESEKPSAEKKVQQAEKPRPVKKEGKVAGMTKAEISAARAEAGLLGLKKGETEAWVSQVEEAKAKGLDKKATAIANDALTSDRRITRPEQAGLTMRMGQVESEIETIGDRLDADAQAGRAPNTVDIAQMEVLQDELDLLTRAVRVMKSETGKDLNFTKILLKVDNFSLAKLRRDVIRLKTQRAKQGEAVKLTEDEEAKLRDISKQIREAEAKLEEVEKKAADVMARTMEEMAGEAFAQESRKATKTRRRKETLKRERADLKNQIQKLGYRVNDITGVPFEVASIISKMAVNHIEDGARSLAEVVERIQQDIPDIEAADVFNSFGGRVKSEVKKATSEAQKSIKELKSQARKLGEIDEILTKGAEKKRKIPRTLSQENDSLQKALNELREMAYSTQMDNAKLADIENRISRIKEQTERGYRDVEDPKRPDSEAVKEARRELKDVRDIQKAVDIIASLEEDLRTGNLQNPTRKQSLRLSDELSRLKKRVESLQGAKKDAKRVKDLQDKITELKKTVVMGVSEKITKRYDENKDIKTAKREIKELRNIIDTESAIKDLEKQIETGDFKVTPERQQRIISDELERARVKLNKLKKEAKNRVASMQPMTRGEMVKELAVNMPRTLLATGDMSGTLRQGLLLSARRPVVAAKAFKTSFKAFWSEHTAESVDLALKSSPMQKTRERAGLYLAGLNEAMSSKEEAFMSRLVQHPFFKSIGVNAVTQASERHMVTHLNLLRASIFDSYAQANPAASDAELAAWADYINKSSGRGDLGDFSSAAKGLSNVLFAPRFTVSRFQTPAALVKNINKHPRVAKEIGKDFVGMGVLGATVMALAKLAGADVGDDPEDADFGKIIIGNTRVDVFAGFLQPFRLASLFYHQAAGRLGWLKKVDPETGEVKRRKARVSFKDALWRFSQYKLAPGVQLGFEVLEGKDVVGKPTSVPEAVARKLIPIVAQGAYDTVKQGKADELLWTTPLEFLGAGINVYEDESQAPDIKRIFKNADYQPSKPKYPDWVDGKVKAEYDIMFGQMLASDIRMNGLTEKDEISKAASRIRKDMLREIPK